MVNLFAIPSLVVFAAGLGFGLWVYSSNRKNSTSCAWFYSSIAISFWGLGLYGVTSSNNEVTALRWQYLLDFSAIFIPVFYLSFIFNFLNRPRKNIERSLFAVTTLIALLSFTKYFKLGMTKVFGFFWVEPGPIYLIFPIFFTIVVVYSLSLVAKSLLTSKSSKEKNQAIFVLISGIIGFGGGATNFFPQLFNVYPFGNYFVALYVALMSYSVIKHRLFNVRVITAQISMFILWVFILLRVLTSVDITEKLMNSILFFVSIPIGILLIRGVIREVEQKEENARLAEGLEKANEKLQELDKKKTEFVSMASHQLRSPITAIKGYSSMLTDGSYGDVGPEVAEAAKVINESSQRLLNTIEDFLDVTRIELGTMKYTFSDVDVLELVNKTVEELKPIAERKKVAVSVSSDPGRYVVNSDSGKLSQVIGNLIDNSLKYIPEKKEGEAPAETKIRVYSEPISKTVRVSITDNGIGIDKKTIPYLFKRFARSEDAAKVNIRGTGQGLFVAKQLLEAQKGRIWAESPGVGLGTTFYIEMPVKA